MLDASQSNLDARGLRIAIVTSRYHGEITESMRQAAVEAFTRSGGLAGSLHQFTAPGSFELTAICSALAQQAQHNGRPVFDAIVALGCVITGETTHDQHIANSVTQGLTAITVQTGVPIAFGVLTCGTIEQARARSTQSPSSRQNKGAEAMMAAIETAVTIRAIHSTGGIR